MEQNEYPTDAVLRSHKDEIELPLTRVPVPYQDPKKWQQDVKSRKAAEERAFTSKKEHWMHNLDLLYRMEKLVESHRTRFTKKGIESLVDLLRRLGLFENDLVDVVLGFYGLRPRHRDKFELFFDDSHIQRDRLQSQVKELEKEIRIKGSAVNKSFFEFEETTKNIESLRDELKVAYANLGVIPKKNSIPPDQWRSHTILTLKKLKRIMKTERGHDLIPAWAQLWKDCRGMQAFSVAGEEPDEEVLLNIWRRTRTIIRGNTPVEKIKGAIKPQGILSSFFKRRDK